jgi:EmrB/QacA subfamily drug resistance transporter
MPAPAVPTSGPDTDAEPAYATLRNPKLRLLIPLIVAFAFLMEQLDATIVTTAIPDMARSLHVAPLQMNSIITAYILSLAVFIPVSGWIADRYGARRVFAAALAIFSAASALCGLSSSLPVLVAMRVLQGFGGAMMTPVGRLVLLRAFPRSQLVTAMTYMTVPAVIGPAFGPILGGLLTTYANWRWIFYVNVPIGLVGVALALRFVEDARLAAPGRFDMAGFLLCGGGLGLLQFGLENLGHPVLPPLAVLGLAGTGLLLLAAYVPYARDRSNAALDLSLFAIRTFRVSTLAGGVSRVGVNAVPFMLPLLFQIGFGLSPVQSGSLTFVSSLGTLVVRPVSARLMRRFGYRGLLTGNGVLCAAVIASFALVQPGTPHWLVFLLVLLFGVVRSTQFMTTNTLTYADTPAGKLSRSTSMGGVIQQLTISFGVSIAAALLSLLAGPGRLPSVADFHDAFLLVALITLASAPGFLQLKPDDGAHVSGYRPAEKPGRGHP